MTIRTALGKVSRLLKELWALFFIADFGTFATYVWLIVSNLPAIARVKGLGPATGKMNGRKCAFTVFGKKIVLDGEYFGRATELYARGVYNALPEFKLRNGMGVVIDLGANIGAFSVLAAKFAKRVIAVEADRLLCDVIRNTAWWVAVPACLPTPPL
jgi:hypothetical protein